MDPSASATLATNLHRFADEVAQDGLALDESAIVPDVWADRQNYIAQRLQGHAEREGDFLSLFFDLLFVGIGTQVVNSINHGVAEAVSTGDGGREACCFVVFFFLFVALSYIWLDAQLFYNVLSVRSSGHIFAFGIQVVSASPTYLPTHYLPTYLPTHLPTYPPPYLRGIQVASAFLIINSLGEQGAATSSFGIRWP